MASLTIRHTRRRHEGAAASSKRQRTDRSMEDEARTILRQAAAVRGDQPRAAKQQRNPSRASVSEPMQKTSGSAGGVAARVLLIVGGGIAAYKSLDLIRRLKERDLAVRCVMTAAARQFVTPLAAGALAGERVFTDLFDAESEFDVGHIRLARDTDLIVVAPATADLMAKMAGGHADDLASAGAACHRSAGVARAGDESADVEPSGDAAQPRAARAPTASPLSDRTSVKWRKAARRALAAWRSHWRSLRRAEPFPRTRVPRATAQGPANAGDFWADARANRSGALYRQPLNRGNKDMRLRRPDLPRGRMSH